MGTYGFSSVPNLVSKSQYGKKCKKVFSDACIKIRNRAVKLQSSLPGTLDLFKCLFRDQIYKENILFKIIFLTIVNNIIILMPLQAYLFYYLSNSCCKIPPISPTLVNVDNVCLSSWRRFGGDQCQLCLIWFKECSS